MIEDLPVAVTLAPPLATEVARWVERDLGWQVVDGGGPLEPVIALADRPCGQLPWIAVTQGAPDGEQVRRHLTAGARDVVAWPQERLRIPLVAAQVEHGREDVERRGRLTVAGAAGGAGTSTVALAIGGVFAWSGAAVLVSGSVDLLALAGVAGGVSGAASGRPYGEGGPAAGGSTASAVPGVDGLSVVADGVQFTTAAWNGDVVVVDAGTALTADATVVVSRADRSLERARASGRPVVVVGDQPLGARECRRVLGDALLALLPLSSRVARAGLRGHVPAALPGTWLRSLRAALARLERRA